jgi:hypothetical protein
MAIGGQYGMWLVDSLDELFRQEVLSRHFPGKLSLAYLSSLTSGKSMVARALSSKFCGIQLPTR